MAINNNREGTAVAVVDITESSGDSFTQRDVETLINDKIDEIEAAFRPPHKLTVSIAAVEQLSTGARSLAVIRYVKDKTEI